MSSSSKYLQEEIEYAGKGFGSSGNSWFSTKPSVIFIFMSSSKTLADYFAISDSTRSECQFDGYAVVNYLHSMKSQWFRGIWTYV